LIGTSAASASVKRASLVGAASISGVVLLMTDAVATRAFYEPILRDAAGAWAEEHGTLRYSSSAGEISFMADHEHRTLSGNGAHQAYQVHADRLTALVDELAVAGHPAEWWREDHPREREVTAYLEDPCGNRVQFVPTSEPPAPRLFIDHIALEVHDLESAEVFYTSVLGGSVDYYHGRRARDYEAAQAWGEGNDPCAPWTRLWPGAGLSTDPHHRSHRPHPNQQAFVRFGETRVALILAREHRQEPAEDQAVGIPRLVFTTSRQAQAVIADLVARPVSLTPEDRMALPFRVEGQRIYLRDPAGNSVEVRCATS
jgi:catechol 2,3-dioxygenase-like lactoylglutathione lyase family enzyme